MSSAMPSLSERDPWLYVEDMLGFAERVMSYSAGIEQQAFFQDAMRCDATLRNLELLGEAATWGPEELRARAPGIPWRQVIATRNRLIHGYLGIDPDTVWSIVADDVPVLAQQLAKLLATR
jgi:uncharacterized protein with HEPN domain